MMQRRLAILVLGSLLSMAGTALAAETPPKVSISRFGELHRPLPFPFDASADATANVDAAIAKAKSSGRLVLIELGANWCVDCRILHGVMNLPEVSEFVERNYVPVTVDIGRLNRNLDVPKRFGLMKRPTEVPVILVVDPQTGKLVNRDDVKGLVDARLSTPQALADWLARWAP